MRHEDNAKMQLEEDILIKFICHIIFKLSRISILRERSAYYQKKELEKEIQKRSDKLIKYYTTNVGRNCGAYMHLAGEFKILILYIVKKIRKGRKNAKYSKDIEEVFIDIDSDRFSYRFSSVVNLLSELIIEIEETGHFCNSKIVDKVLGITKGKFHQYEINGISIELKKLEEEKLKTCVNETKE